MFVAVVTGAGAADPPAAGPSRGQSPPVPLTDIAATTIAPGASAFWLVPDRREVASLSPALQGFATGVSLAENGATPEALRLVSAPALAATPLADYATYYTAVIQQRLDRLDQARATLGALRARGPTGYLSVGALVREAEVAAAQSDHAAAVILYEQALAAGVDAPDAVLLALAKSAQMAGDRQRAAAAFGRIYGEFPASDAAASAEDELAQLPEWSPVAPGNDRYAMELRRGERLLAERRFADARASFERLRPHASGDDAEMVALRLAECDIGLRRYRGARETLRPWLERGTRRAETLYHYLSAVRGLGATAEYVALTRRLVRDFPDTTWAVEALNRLASHYIVEDDDERATETFREILARYPEGRHAERAAWKVGWWEYRHDRYVEARALLDAAATRFPRSDYRPAFLYWSARASEHLSDHAAAEARDRALAIEYRNSYYGRLGLRKLRARGTGASPSAGAPAASFALPASAAPPNAAVIRLLIALELYDQAQKEVEFALRTWGPTPLLQATAAWLAHVQRDWRVAIILMKRAYPQYLTSDGDHLPREILRVITPLDHWDLIHRHASAHRLDPYLMAALVNQESTFDAEIRSRANAIGLMQILPSTGRRYARKLGIRRFSTRMLTRPEINVRIGMAYFADLVKQYGSTHLALAAYNAGESRVNAWMAERPGLAQDEFIDDIPFPETQTYVRRVLGMVDDYRSLYADGTGSQPGASAAEKPPSPPTRKPSLPKKK